MVKGRDLNLAQHLVHLMEPLIRKVDNAQIVEQAAILGTLSPEILAPGDQAEQAADFDYGLARAQLADASAQQRTLEELRKRRR